MYRIQHLNWMKASKPERCQHVTNRLDPKNFPSTDRIHCQHDPAFHSFNSIQHCVWFETQLTLVGKHGEKDPQSFFHCDSFDHPSLHSLKEYKKNVFHFCDCKIRWFGTCDILLERYFQDFSNGIIQAPKYLKCLLVSQENTNMQLFSDCRAWWSKEPHWKNDYGSFSPCFLLVYNVVHGEKNFGHTRSKP